MLVGRDRRDVAGDGVRRAGRRRGGCPQRVVAGFELGTRVLALEVVEQRLLAAGAHPDRLDDRQGELAARAAASNRQTAPPREVAMLSATTTGWPGAELQHEPQVPPQVGRVETATTTSGRASSRSRPSTKSQVICSSGVRGLRLYAPGRSRTRTRRPPAVRSRPSLRSTVTPA